MGEELQMFFYKCSQMFQWKHIEQWKQYGRAILIKFKANVQVLS